VRSQAPADFRPQGKGLPGTGGKNASGLNGSKANREDQQTSGTTSQITRPGQAGNYYGGQDEKLAEQDFQRKKNPMAVEN